MPEGNRRRLTRVKAPKVVAQLGAKGALLDCTVENISVGGAFLRAGKPLAVGTVVQLTLMSPGTRRAPSLKATVRSALTAPGMSGMGVQFEPPQGEDVERLLALLQGLGVPVLELPVLTRRPVEPGAEGGGDVAQLQLQVQALLVALDESDRALENCRRERTALAREVIKLRAALEKH